MHNSILILTIDVCTVHVCFMCHALSWWVEVILHLCKACISKVVAWSLCLPQQTSWPWILPPRPLALQQCWGGAPQQLECKNLFWQCVGSYILGQPVCSGNVKIYCMYRHEGISSVIHTLACTTNCYSSHRQKHTQLYKICIYVQVEQCMLLTSDQESLFSSQGLNLTTTALPTVHLSFTCHTLYVRQGFFILHT